MKKTYIMVIMIGVFVFGYHQVQSKEKYNMKTPEINHSQNTHSAVFAGGCFWCTESDFEKVDGVVEVISGYAGGQIQNPTYKEVSSGKTDHIEVIKVIYDPAVISYTKLLDVFWRHVDPTDSEGQFVDRGAQYRSAIFYDGDEERHLAEASKKEIAKNGPFNTPIVTEILPLTAFYPAEDYHQDYHKKNPLRYKWYRSGSGRDQFLKKTWAAFSKTHLNETVSKKTVAPAAAPLQKLHQPDQNTNFKIPTDEELRSRLTPLQYKVTREEGTEPPFKNLYWDNHAEGIYVDIVSGEPLFSSLDKFESGTGWPSFTRTLANNHIVERKDRSFLMVRTEVRSKDADSHLGHLFNDGPQPTGLRYCINSAALRFIPKMDLGKEGLEKYKKLFE